MLGSVVWRGGEWKNHEAKRNNEEERFKTVLTRGGFFFSDAGNHFDMLLYFRVNLVRVDGYLEKYIMRS